MARSRRKSPCTGITTSDTEKWWKRQENRRYRRAVKQALARGDDPLPLWKQYCNPWLGPKDGRIWWGSEYEFCHPTYAIWVIDTPEERRTRYRKLMRK